MIDTHAHLDALERPGRAVERALEAGVTRVISVGTSVRSGQAVLALCGSELPPPSGPAINRALSFARSWMTIPSGALTQV